MIGFKQRTSGIERDRALPTEPPILLKVIGLNSECISCKVPLTGYQFQSLF